MNLSQRLRNLREDNDLRQEDVANILGTTRQYYYKYEKGEHPFPIKHLIVLAKYYHVSTDYILGLTDETKPYPPSKDYRADEENKK